jgi:hypothetical protein
MGVLRRVALCPVLLILALAIPVMAQFTAPAIPDNEEFGDMIHIPHSE